MNLNIAICDDDIDEIKLISSLIDRYQIQYNNNIFIDTYTSPDSLLANYTHAGKYNILFLDVEMPGMNGLELADRIRRLPDKQVKIVFVSNYPEYMQDSFNVQAFHYIKKPLTFERFSDLLERIISEYEDNNSSKFVFKHEDHSELINMSDILYIETIKGRRDYIKIVTIDGEYEGKGSLSEYEESLASESFIAPHRSILVNLNHVKLIYKNELVLDDDSHVPLSRRREKEIRELFSRQYLTIHQKMY